MRLRAAWGLALLAVSWSCSSSDVPDVGGSGGGHGGSGGRAVGGGGAAGGEATDPCAALEARLGAILQGAQAKQTAPGATAMAVTTPDCGLWAGAEGPALAADSLVRMGSVTKTYVAAAVLALAEEGALSLEDALEDWVPNVPHGDEITLRQLLDHTSGVFSYTSDLAFMLQALQAPDVPVTPEELVAVAIAQGPDFSPGTAWSYSNTGYILLGMVLEAASGQSAGAVLAERAFAPAGLARTFLDGEHALPEPLAPGHASSGDDVTHALHPSVPWTAGAVAAEVSDVARWLTALHRGEVIAAASLDAMYDVVPTGNAGHGYGLGMSELLPPVLPVRAVGHSGGIPGYMSLAFYLPDHDSAIVVVVTGDGRSPGLAFLEGIDAIVAR